MISVIIPVLNEARTIAPLMAALDQETICHEVLVVDGGSRDGTAELAREMGGRVVCAEAGRGNQICRGVAHASGDVLLFLHADTVFPAGGLQRISETLAKHSQIAGGNFRLVFDGETRFSKALTVFYGWIRRFGLYYGDSGVFVRRSVYNAMGGMRPIPLMEDIDFIRRLERFGRTCRIESPPLITSSRRFHDRHAMAIIFGWIKLHVLFWCGVAPDRLARMYRAQQPRAAARGKHGRTESISACILNRFGRHSS